MSDQLQSNLLGGRTKVQSRILSSKVLAVEIASIIESLRAVILPPTDEDVEPPRKMTKVEVEAGEDTHNKYSTGASTFLPSLSVGFIKGNEDPDWSESDTKAGDIKQKKNRRDQRARRA